jgi:hypothetical protein
LRKVVSGGQTGVDRAALYAARASGLAIGGWCPPGRASEDGPIDPALPLTETPEDRSPDAPSVPRSQRTEWNVRDSDATLLLIRGGEGKTAGDGAEWTQKAALRDHKPLLICDPTEKDACVRIADWIEVTRVHTLNVAGPSEGESPGIGAIVDSLLQCVFRRLKAID